MSGIWPFFNSSFSNASINKILAEIDIDQQRREKAEQKKVEDERLEQEKRKRAQKKAVKDKQKAGSKRHPRDDEKDTSKVSVLTNLAAPMPVSSIPGSSQAEAKSTTSHEVAFSPASQQFHVTASQLLHSIKENDSTIIQQTRGEKPAGKGDAKNREHVKTELDTGQEPKIAADTRRMDLKSELETGESKAVPAVAVVSAIPASIVSEPASSTSSSISSSSSDSSLSSSGSLPRLPAHKRCINVGLLNKLLDQPNLMDEINLAKNQRLINYISQTDVVEVIIDFILYSLELAKRGKEPSGDELKNEIFAEYVELAKDGSNMDDSDNLGLSEDTDGEPDVAEGEERLTMLEKALQRASVCSEILILPNTNILGNLMASRTLMTRLWRGFFDKGVEYYFKSVSANVDDDVDVKDDMKESAKGSIKESFKKNVDEDVNSDDIDIDDDDDDDGDDSSNDAPSIYSDSTEVTDLNGRPLIDEEQYERMRFKDNHSLLLLNNFLKLVDDMAAMNMNELMNFIRFEQSHRPLTDQFLALIPYSATACDLLVRLISTDKPYSPNGLIDILLDQNLVLRLFDLCRIHYRDHQVQDNLCNLLNGIVGISSNVGFWDDPAMATGGQQLNEFGEPADPDQQNMLQANNPNVGPNDLTRQLVSRPCVEQMLDIVINRGHYGLVTVVSVVIEVIRKNNSDYDEFDWIGCAEEVEERGAGQGGARAVQENEQGGAKAVQDIVQGGVKAVQDVEQGGAKAVQSRMPSSRDPVYLGVMLKLFSLRLDEIVQTYLTDKYATIRQIGLTPTASGEKIEPLKYERFKVMELIAELLHCSNMILMNKSIDLDRLVYRRDQWRDVRHTESLVSDALSDHIGDNSRLVSGMQNLSLQAEEESRTDASYVEIPSDLSIGNFFKLRLLQTHAIPLIALKMHRFPWNNFMHNVVFDLVQQIFNGRLANWDEDQASNQEETRYDDNLSLNKVLIWSLFGDFDHFTDGPTSHHCNYVANNEFPGFFNLPKYILFCYKLSEQKEAASNFKLGYMGHLTLIAEEVHKFQNYVENFGIARDDQTFTLLKEESDSSSIFYRKSSFYVFNTLYEQIFESGRFDDWNNFVATTLKDLNSMYNKVLGNPSDLAAGDTSIDAPAISEDGIPISSPPTNEDAIILDNGDSEEFRRPVPVINEEAEGDDEENEQPDNPEPVAGEKSGVRRRRRRRRSELSQDYNAAGDPEGTPVVSTVQSLVDSTGSDENAIIDDVQENAAREKPRTQRVYGSGYADYADYDDQLDDDGLSGGDLRPMAGHHADAYDLDDSNEPNNAN